MTGVFVTGTGTNVGKTVVSAALLHRYRCVAPLRYWKPVQTGAPEDDDSATVTSLGGCAAKEIWTRGMRLPKPLSPHLSAELCGVEIHVSSLLELMMDADSARRWVIEGAGGVLVPLSLKESMADLMAALGLPAVIVASSGLGTINHTLLSVEALRKRSIEIAGIVLNGEPNADNRRAIETIGDVAVIGEMPPFGALTPAVLARWAMNELDPNGLLGRWFEGLSR